MLRLEMSVGVGSPPRDLNSHLSDFKSDASAVGLDGGNFLWHNSSKAASITGLYLSICQSNARSCR